jgi:outer membrane protein OmpA-like peptidoglycan-associated protein/tetratricopeptide (TPR) repeat protein
MKNSALLLVLLSFSFVFVVKAEKESYVEKGDKLMKNFCFDQAADAYKTAATRDTNDVVAWEKLGNTYLILDDYQSAEPVYKILSTHPLAKPIDKFYYGQVLRANGKYTEAQEAYTAFFKADSSNSLAIEFKNFSESIKPILEDKKLYELSPFAFNTAVSEIGPAFYADRIAFASNRDAGNPIKHTEYGSGKPFYDIYRIMANDTDKKNMPVKLKGNINGKFNEGPATFTSDGSEIIFTRTQYITKGTDRISRLGLFHAEYSDKQGWINIEPLPFNSFTYNVAHPSLSTDGKKLYFISDMPGGFGETDIYVSEKKDSIWGTPVNLGKSINTPGREMFPFIEDNTKLYFSSDSRVGLGGLDLYSAFLSNDKWIYLTNLGAPVNTTSDDYGYASDVTGKKGFVVSNRPGGKGEDDIYAFVRKDQQVLNLPTVYFDSSSAVLRADAKIILDTLAAVMIKNAKMVVELSGHTDSRGTKEFNVYLAQQRANVCEDYLATVGIDKSRIITSGYGEEKLVNRCADDVPCSEAEHALNRRVEFKIIKIY